MGTEHLAFLTPWIFSIEFQSRQQQQAVIGWWEREFLVPPYSCVAPERYMDPDCVWTIISPAGSSAVVSTESDWV